MSAIRAAARTRVALRTAVRTALHAHCALRQHEQQAAAISELTMLLQSVEMREMTTRVPLVSPAQHANIHINSG